MGVVALAALVAGAVLVGVAVLRGGASAALIVIFPVVYGGSVGFLVGVLLIVVGLILLPLGWARLPEDDGESAAVSTAGPPEQAAGGVLLIGPVPILFGSARNLSRRGVWALVAVGVALTAVLVGVTLYLVR